jgi:hypothetical protein
VAGSSAWARSSDEIDGVLAEVDRAYYELTGLIERIQSTDGWIIMLLAGARPDVLQQVDARMSGTRAALTDTCTMLRLTKDDLRGYLKSI